MSMSRLARRLRRRLEHEGVALPPVVHIDRTYAGHHQKAQGAWSWELCDADGRFLGVGSQHTASECAAAAKLSFWSPWPHTDLHVFVERPRAAGRGAEPGQHPTHRLDQPNQEIPMTERQPDDNRPELDRAADERKPQIHSIEQRDGREVHVFDFTGPGVADRLRRALAADRNEQEE